ncbi:unnamed protein product, partial [Allacma fusca]
MSPPSMRPMSGRSDLQEIKNRANHTADE